MFFTYEYIFPKAHFKGNKRMLNNLGDKVDHNGMEIRYKITLVQSDYSKWKLLF